VFAGGLHPAADTTVVRAQGGKVVITDGPFAETKEQIGGYDVVECLDMDTALQVAAGHPLAQTAQVEVRPFWDAPWND
jgi:hypothetical protein